MLARRSVFRRPLAITFFVCVCLYIIFAFGPPVFTPSSSANTARDRATQWAHSLENDISAIYHTTSSVDDNPKIRQATMLFEGDKDHMRNMYDRSVGTHLKHGERWGVPTHILKSHLVEPGSYFNKPAWLLNLLMTEMAKPKNRRAEWIIWFDADSVIMNPEISWSIFLPPPDFNDKHILATQDNNGFNAGMMFLRVHEWTISMLAEAVALPRLKPDIELPFFDQSAIAYVCNREGYQEHFLYQPRKWWNRYHHDADGDEVGEMVIHFAGVSSVLKGSTTKIEFMTKFLERVERTPEAWTKSVKETKYEQEVEDYWNLLRRSRKALEKAREAQEQGKMSESKERLVEGKIQELIQVVLKWANDVDKVSEANKHLEVALRGGQT